MRGRRKEAPGHIFTAYLRETKNKMRGKRLVGEGGGGVAAERMKKKREAHRERRRQLGERERLREKGRGRERKITSLGK